MAVTATHLLTGEEDIDATSFTTASISPSADKLVLVAVNAKAGEAAPTVTGCGLTWVQVDHLRFGTQNAVTVLRGMGASPSAGALTIDFGANTETCCLWSINEFGGVDTSGTNGSGAIVQSASNSAGGAGALTVTLAAFASTNNATYGAFGHQGTADRTFVAGSGFTILAQVWSSAGPAMIGTEWRADNDTSVDVTLFTGLAALTGIAVEIKADTTSPLGFNTTLRNNSLDEIAALAGTSAQIILYSGTQPATGGTVTTEVATLVGNASAFAPAASGGVLTVNAVTADESATGGTATWGRINSNGGTTHVADFTVGTTGTDMVLTNNVIAAGSSVGISSFTITDGNP